MFVCCRCRGHLTTCACYFLTVCSLFAVAVCCRCSAAAAAAAAPLSPPLSALWPPPHKHSHKTLRAYIPISKPQTTTAAERIGVFAEPELEFRYLGPHDSFLIIASDGVFEFISSQRVVDMVSVGFMGGVVVVRAGFRCLYSLLNRPTACTLESQKPRVCLMVCLSLSAVYQRVVHMVSV